MAAYGAEHSSPEVYSETDLLNIDAILDQTLTHTDIPGIVIGMTSGTETLYIRSAGLRRLDQPDPLEPSDVIHIGSCGKAMTATLAAVMVEAGLLGWDDVPEGYVERSTSRRPPPPSVTLHRLLTHQADIEPMGSLPDFDMIPPLEGDVMVQRAALTQWLLPRTKPEYEYSNAGYSIAASMLESALGDPWEILMIDFLFEPLGMTGFYGWPGLIDANQPWGHWLLEIDGPLVPQDPFGDYHLPLLIAPAGDVSMTMADYLAFLREHLRGLRGESEYLSQETFTFLHTPNGKVGGSDYACGWIILPNAIDGTTIHMHNGSGGTFFILMLMAPEADFAVAVCINAATLPLMEAVNELTIELVTRHLAKIRPVEPGGGRTRSSFNSRRSLLSAGAVHLYAK